MGGIQVLDDGDTADALLACLRKRGEQFAVGIDEPGGDQVMVSALGNRVDDLPAFLEDALEKCGTELDVDWTRFLRVLRG